MSLLEDVFLQDEANEAEELERVIEGDEFEERRRSDSDENSEKEDEAEEDRRKVDPSKPKAARMVKNPRVLLNPARLTGPRGIQIIPDHFKDFKFKGRGHEKEDLDLVLKKLEHWAYRLYPKYQFEDCLKKIEILGKKRPVAVHLHKIRSDQFLSEDTVVQKDSSDEDTPMPVQEEDEFDKLLKQQIELARSTPAPSSAKKLPYDSFSPPKDSRTTSLMMPKATTSQSINEEQRNRMIRSRKLAEERRLARLKNAANNNIPQSISLSQVSEAENTAHKNAGTTKISEEDLELDKDTDEMEVVRKHHRSNVIESSDDETIVETNLSIAVDVHTASGNGAEDNNIVTVGTNSNSIFNGENTVAEETTVKNVENDEAISTSNDNDSNKSTVRDNTTQNNNDENVISCENMEKNDEPNLEKPVGTNLDAVEVVADSSGANEELRYDDSDVNIDVNDESIKDKSNENTNDSSTGMVLKNDMIDEPNQILSESAIVPKSINENEVQVAEELIDDIMDVDFSEDF